MSWAWRPRRFTRSGAVLVLADPMLRISSLLGHHLGWALRTGLVVIVGAPPEAHAVTGAEIGRNTPHRHGRFEARLRFAAGDGIVSSLFLWKPGSELEDTFWNEVDIEKVGSDCRGYSSNVIYGNPEVQSTERVSAPVDLCSEYHTHTVEWTPEHLIWQLDGVEVRRLDDGELAAFEDNASEGLQLRFNLWVGNPSFGGSFSSASLPAQQYIDWAAYSAYTPGMGASGGDFTPVWREDFDAPLGSEWSYGTWLSPLGNSIHSPANVSVVAGIGVLSLTEDDATGYSGTPPTDATGDAGSAGGASGDGASAGAAGRAGTGGAGTGGAGGASASSGAAGAASASSQRPRSSAGCELAPGAPAHGAELLCSIGWLCRRLARRRSARHRQAISGPSSCSSI